MGFQFRREQKEERPVLAICYDFDKTLSPDDMQAQGYIQSVGYDIADFWKESNDLAESNEMDSNLAYMFLMKELAEGQLPFTRSTLMEYGSRVQLFPGVQDWFSRIREYGREHGVIVEHYIISSGLKEMIEGTTVAGEFKKIYASSFYYNQMNVAVWPAQVVNYTNKTQFLFRIEKGVLDANDPAVNESFAPEEMRVPFRNMVYIGDSDTDIPCMKLVNSYGGHSIGVYNGESGEKAKVHKMLREERIRYYVPADYSEGQPLDRLLKTIIQKTAISDRLENVYYDCKKDTEQSYAHDTAGEHARRDMILALESSFSFAYTHELIARLNLFKGWTQPQRELLCRAAVENSQVRCILTDADLRRFFEGVLDGMEPFTPEAMQIRKLLDEKPKK